METDRLPTRNRTKSEGTSGMSPARHTQSNAAEERLKVQRVLEQIDLFCQRCRAISMARLSVKLRRVCGASEEEAEVAQLE
eukprot:2515520-Rhodomonas_salina.1